jgi:secernin
MCDSFVALGNSTASGSVLLAKSADTSVNEAQHLVRQPRREYRDGAFVRITHLNIPQARVTHETILGKSFWTWGTEVACNEHGVAAGNEGAFSNQKEEAKQGVTVVDLLRLAVERAATAREAVDVIAHHVETYGQSGNSQFYGNFFCDTGILVSDLEEAYVVNCAGRHWAARKVDDVMAISNRYQIADDWELSSLRPDNGTKPDFRAAFADEEAEEEVAASRRESRAQSLLETRKGSIEVKDMADILRDVGDDPEAYSIPDDERPTRICMHAGPHEARFWHATNAMISDAGVDGVTVWMTGTSATDLSVFKPLFFGVPMPDIGPMPLGTYAEGTLWWKHERLHRRAIADYAVLKPEIRADFDPLEEEFFAAAPSVVKATANVKSAFVADCWRRAEVVTDRWIEKLERRNFFIEHGPYREMWDGLNREASFPI